VTTSEVDDDRVGLQICRSPIFLVFFFSNLLYNEFSRIDLILEKLSLLETWPFFRAISALRLTQRRKTHVPLHISMPWERRQQLFAHAIFTK
jgi:hypothetical protein